MMEQGGRVCPVACSTMAPGGGFCRLAGMPHSEPTSALTALALGNDNNNNNKNSSSSSSNNNNNRLRAC